MILRAEEKNKSWNGSKTEEKKYSSSLQFYLESRLAVCYPCFFLCLSFFIPQKTDRPWNKLFVVIFKLLTRLRTSVPREQGKFSGVLISMSRTERKSIPEIKIKREKESTAKSNFEYKERKLHSKRENENSRRRKDVGERRSIRKLFLRFGNENTEPLRTTYLTRSSLQIRGLDELCNDSTGLSSLC